MTEQQNPAEAGAIPDCPRCEGAMWDNRVGKRNPKAPDFKCKDKGCDGVIWPPRTAATAATPVAAPGAPGAEAAPAEVRPPAAGMPACPICGGAMWDDRSSKRNPKAPDFKCRNKPKERGGPGCEGIIWPPRDGSPGPYPVSAPGRAAGAARSVPPADDTPFPDEPPPFDDAPAHDDNDLPF